MSDPALEWLAARGTIASGVAAELSGPLEAIYAKLKKAVERLDRHVATARGPEPLPYLATSEIRERVADVFMQIGRVRLLAASLAELSAASSPKAVDLNEVVERALVLAHHRIAADSDTTLDLSTVPPVHADPARLAQALSLLLIHAAATAAPSGTIALHSEPVGTAVRLRIEAIGEGIAEALPFGDVIRSALESDGCKLAIESGPGSLRVELLLPRGAPSR